MVNVKIKTLKVATFTLNGREIQATYLGAGHYAKAFRDGSDVYILVKDCLMKEAIAMFAQGHVHVPVVEKLDSLPDEETVLYRMDYYEPLTSAHKTAWQHFRALQRILEDARSTRDFGHDIMNAVCDGAREAKLPDSLIEALEALTIAGSTYGDGVCFEFAQRNLGVDEQGRLVLRDILFDADKIQREYAEKARQVRRW